MFFRDSTLEYRKQRMKSFLGRRFAAVAASQNGQNNKYSNGSYNSFESIIHDYTSKWNLMKRGLRRQSANLRITQLTSPTNFTHKKHTANTRCDRRSMCFFLFSVNSSIFCIWLRSMLFAGTYWITNRTEIKSIVPSNKRRESIFILIVIWSIGVR